MANTIKSTDPQTQVFQLTADEIEYPYQVVTGFFLDTNLPEIRRLFRCIFDTCLTTAEGPFSRADQRANLIHMIRNLERVMEAGYLITQLLTNARE